MPTESKQRSSSQGDAGAPRQPRTAGQTLAESRRLVGPALRAAVEQLPEPTRSIAGYHLGWQDAQGQPTDSAAGKMIRPALALVAAEAVGAQGGEALRGAVAVELIHNFSLLHDDLMDGDRIRHHRPTVWALFGVPAAVLTGDALWSLASRVLGESGSVHAGQAARMLATAVGELIDGQGADLDFERRPDVTLHDCIQMAGGKTASLLGCACALGGLLGGGTDQQVRCLQGFGERVGLAFQVVDDLLGIWGTATVTGKPEHSDLANRKKSLPVVFALNSQTDASAELAELYGLDRPLSTHELRRAAGAVEAAGGRDWAQREADRLTTEALGLLHAADPEPTAAAELASLADLIAHRNH